MLLTCLVFQQFKQQNGVAGVEAVLWLFVSGGRKHHPEYSLCCIKHSRHRGGLVAASTSQGAKKRGQPDPHERGHVLYSLRHQQRGSVAWDAEESSGLSPAVSDVQLGVHPVPIHGGGGGLHVQPSSWALPGVSSQHRAGNRAVARRCSILSLLLDCSKQSVHEDETELQ